MFAALVTYCYGLKMNVKERIRAGLKSTPKTIPAWYLFDKEGTGYAYRIMKDNPHYYMREQETFLLKGHVQDIVSQIASPCVLFDLGSGDCVKSRIFIDAILQKQPTLRFIPVDTSKDNLEEACEFLARDYGNPLDIRAIPDDYSVGIDEMGNIKETKLIIWVGGGLQIQPYDVQVSRLQHISQVMSENDRLIIGIDINQNAEEVEKAYLDPEGISVPYYLNGLWRLNREYGSDIDTTKLELEAKFVKRTETTATSYVWVRAKAKEDQSCDIPGLGMILTLEKGEYINIFEGKGHSCKYTIEQMRSIVEKGNLHLDKTWIDPKQRVAVCCIVKQHD